MKNEPGIPRRAGNPFMSFFSRPVVGIVGSLASVVGILLAVYFYLGTRESKDLTYYVHPAKAVVVRVGHSSRLSLALDDKPLSSDVTAVQIAFWNAGKSPIKKEHVLKSMKITTSPEHPIIETIVRKRSRDVIGINLDESLLNKGELGVSWDILEKNDGGIIQIVYAGTVETPIGMSATIEGQEELRRLEFSEKLRSPSEQYEWLCRKKRRSAYTFLIMGTIMTFLVGVMLFLRRKKRHRKLQRSDWFMILQPVVFIVMAVVELLRASPPGPPFGF